MIREESTSTYTNDLYLNQLTYVQVAVDFVSLLRVRHIHHLLSSHAVSQCQTNQININHRNWLTCNFINQTHRIGLGIILVSAKAEKKGPRALKSITYLLKLQSSDRLTVDGCGRDR
jgi:hypothetical protein